MKGRLVVIGVAPLLSVNRPAYRHLQRMGWDVTLVVPDDAKRFGCESLEREGELGVAIRQVAFEGPSVRQWIFAGIEEILHQLKPDLVHLDGEPDSRGAIQVGQWCSAVGCRFTIMSCENIRYSLLSSLLHFDFKRLVRDFLLNRFLRKSRQLIDHVFVLSSDSVEVMRRMGFGNRTTQIPLGFDENVFYPSEERRIKWQNKLGLNGLVIGYFGRMIPEKGVHILLDILQELKDVPFTFVMDEFQMSSAYQQQVRAQLDESELIKVTKFVHVTHAEMPGCLNAMDIVVVPSLSSREWKEQYGRVVPEAMMSGCAVVVSRTGALPELLGDAGVSFEMGDKAGAVAMVRKLLLEEKLRKSLTVRSVDRARLRLTALRQAEQMQEVFTRL